MRDDARIYRTDQLELALELVEVTGAMDLAWSWGIEFVQGTFGDGWLLTCGFARPDRDSGAPGRGLGRPLFVRAGATAREVWGTVFVAFKLIVEHELLEGFKVSGRRVFGPHAPMVVGP